VIVIGGSYAGMAAALQVARTRRPVMVIDAGERRNRFAGHAHGFLGRDGVPPREIAREAREQLMTYANLVWLEGRAMRACKEDDGFVVETEDGVVHRAARLVLATGVSDELPNLAGLTERWGRTVFHCPYCHGYELGDGPIGVLGCHLLSVHQAEVVADWGRTIYFVNGTGLMTDEARRLKARGISIETAGVEDFAGEGIEARLTDGRTVPLSGLFVVSKTAMASDLAAQLGCAFDEGITGPCIRVDTTMRTTVPGVFACGDAARISGSVSLAVGDGAAAGAAAHQSLIFG
jgi:thioredoxin reductase